MLHSTVHSISNFKPLNFKNINSSVALLFCQLCQLVLAKIYTDSWGILSGFFLSRHILEVHFCHSSLGVLGKAKPKKNELVGKGKNIITLIPLT